ncbi:heme-binding domain-containing protein [Chryseobacterium timonianum]|uniref:heme-binding domain-containing protein n=1 Tax=Chryseobacterium timonianum TaxID=1805473 RepID=UPI001F4BA542|nr:heme-binding domain-containing protein [Chryseobacterium timonianum]
MKTKQKNSTLKKTIFIILIIFVAIQFFPTEKNVSSVPSGKVFVDTFKANTKVNAILSASCYDCHSNNTRYPWYSNVRPISWFLANHISKGKEKLNFDELPSFGPRKVSSKFTQIIHQIDEEKMPLKSYQAIHKEAKLSKEDRQLLVDFFNSKIKN